jgi:hypothetical protein
MTMYGTYYIQGPAVSAIQLVNIGRKIHHTDAKLCLQLSQWVFSFLESIVKITTSLKFQEQSKPIADATWPLRLKRNVNPEQCRGIWK